jgi:osmotically-inducible protein OsmY
MTRRKSAETQTEKRILEALARTLDIDHLKVSLVGGVPYIEGSVCSLREKRHAAEIVGSICGRACIVNRLRVAPAVRQSDEVTARAAHERLRALGEAAPSSAHVSCHSGVVLLTGEVESWGARQAADKAVRLVRGVTNVVNHLHVKGGDKPAQETESEIKKALRRFLSLDTVNVAFDGGTVLLSGTVPSPYHRLAAEDLVRWFSPVSEVINVLTISGPLPLSQDTDTIQERETSVPSA